MWQASGPAAWVVQRDLEVRPVRVNNPPAFGDPVLMDELARDTDDGYATSMGVLIARAGHSSLLWAPPEELVRVRGGRALEVTEDLNWLGYCLGWMWGRCAVRVSGFGAPSSPEADGRFASPLAFRCTWYLHDAQWVLLVAEAAESGSGGETQCALSAGEIAGTAGSYLALLDGSERQAASRRVAGACIGGSDRTLEPLAHEIEMLYLAYHRYCCRTEVLGRCALERPDDPSLGSLFGLLVAAAVGVVGVLETVEAMVSLPITGSL